MPTTHTCSTSQNINTIAAGAAAGDTIELAAGTHYLAPAYIHPATHTQGTLANPITITGPASGTATMSYQWSSSGTYQFFLEDMDYWIIDGVNVENFTNNAVIVSAKTKDSTGCQVLNMDISNQTVNINTGLGFGAGYHVFIAGGEPTNTSVGTLRDFTADNVNIYGGRPVNIYGYNEVFTIFGACDNVTVNDCSVNQSYTGIAFNCLGAGYGLYNWRAGQPHNVTWTNNSVIDLQAWGGICNAFYADRPGDNCLWENNFAYAVRTLFAWGWEPGFTGGCTEYGNGVFRYNRGVIKANGVYGLGSGTGMEIGSYDASNTYASGSVEVHGNVLVFQGLTADSNGISMRRCSYADVHDNIVHLHSGNAQLYYTTWNSTNTYSSSWTHIFSNNQYYSNSKAGSWSRPNEDSVSSVDAWNTKTNVSGEFVKLPTFTDVNGDSYSDFFVTNGGTTSGTLNADFSYTKSALTVVFTDTSSGQETVDEWAWDFDLANAGTDVDTVQNPTNVYAADGSYTVRLTASSDEGSDSVTKQISVATGGGGGDALAEQVTASGDDCEGNAGSWWYNNLGWCSFGDKESASTNYDFSAGVRFALSAAIPSDAVITSATIELYAVWQDGPGLPTARIYAEDAADPAAWTNKADYDGRSLTTAYQDWSISSWNLAQWHTSPNFASVIQELVDDNAGLASAAHIIIRIGDSSSGWGGTNTLISFQSYDGGASNAAKLNIEWDVPPTSKRILKRAMEQGFISPLDWGIN